MTLSAECLVLATHYSSSGPAFELESYLADRTGTLLFIAHPLSDDIGHSYFRHYEAGRLVRRGSTVTGTDAVGYLQHITTTLRWVNETGIHFDGFIAGDNLLALAGLWERWRDRADWTVMYSIDFVPHRFRSRSLNWIYHAIDRFAASHVNVIWNVSDQIRDARRSRDGSRRVAPQLVVPIGTHFDRIHRLHLSDANATQLVFLGHLLEKQGLQLAIQGLPRIRERIPQASILVIGRGPHESVLKELADRYRVTDSIDFRGYVEDHEEIESLLAASAVALAPYVPDPLSFTRFADPMKIKTYLACGLPIVLTDVPDMAQTVATAGAGTIIPYEVGPLVDAVAMYLENPAQLQAARAAAAQLGARYLWSEIFAEAMGRTAELIGGRSP
jgi:glycosyltransferase involved in cell wall biosynthesis